MKIKEELIFKRKDHFERYITESINQMMCDGITRQMNNHEVSQKFSPNRIVEVFRELVSKEKDMFYSYLSLQRNILKSNCQHYLNRIEKAKVLYSKESQAVFQKNNEARKKLNDINMKEKMRDWKFSIELDSKFGQIDHFSEHFTNKVPYLQRVKRDLCEIKSTLDEFKTMILNQKKSMYSTLQCIKDNMYYLMICTYSRRSSSTKMRALSDFLLQTQNDIHKKEIRLQNTLELIYQRGLNKDEIYSFNPTDLKFCLYRKQKEHKQKMNARIRQISRIPNNKENFIADTLAKRIEDEVKSIDMKYEQLVLEKRIRIDYLKMKIEKIHMQLYQQNNQKFCEGIMDTIESFNSVSSEFK